jgi:hypothetical protein
LALPFGFEAIVFHNQHFKTLEKLTHAIVSEVEAWKKLNNVLQKLNGIIKAVIYNDKRFHYLTKYLER